MRRRRGSGWLALAALSLSGCGKPSPPPVPSALGSASTPPVVAGVCPKKRSMDPPRGELRPAMLSFKAHQYADAQHALAILAKHYPNSATVRVWQGDAVLFDKAKKEVEAADEAIPLYRQAEKLHDGGCTLPEYEQYYLRMGLAYAYLRKREPDPAQKELELALKRWDDSAEIYYHLARAACLRHDVDGCAKNFQKCLEVTKSLKRPLFLRTHHAVADWIRRSRTQSEFGPLRSDPRYQKIIAAIRKR